VRPNVKIHLIFNKEVPKFWLSTIKLALKGCALAVRLNTTFNPSSRPEKEERQITMDAHASSSAVVASQTDHGADRRRYPRLVFSPKDGVTAGLYFTTPYNAPLFIQAMVMNLSRGGLGMGILRDEMGGLNLVEGERLTVAELRIAYRRVSLALETEAQIRWTIDAEYLEHICFGCAFNAPGETLEQNLTRFVEANFPQLTLG
jgi:hypothetical protein